MRRFLPTLTAATAVLAFASTVPAYCAETTLSIRPTPGQPGNEWTAVIRGAAGSPYVLFAQPEGMKQLSMFLTSGVLDGQGRATYAFDLPAAFQHLGLNARVRALSTDAQGHRSSSNDAGIGCSVMPFERFGADHQLHAVTVAAGEEIAEQWSAVGMHVSAVSAVAGPDMVIAFDSSNPTGGDLDLVTPGPGTGNDFAFHNLMIIAENDIDLDADGLVDDPDDAQFGGTMSFTWDSPVLAGSVTLVDVDAIDLMGAEVRTYLAGALVENLFVPGLDDNNVQIVPLDSATRIDELQVEFSGSGAVAEVEFLPCPLHLNFDESTTGIPFGRQTGEIVDLQWLGQGVSISGVTNNPAHPDAVVIFDTANPTGGDTDLVTPGYGIGNTEARGQVLILAENVVDANADGLVDDPGDSPNGGTFTIDFSTCVTLESGTVLDIDSAEPDCFFEAFDENGLSLGTWPLAQIGDNSIQTIDFGGLPLVRRLELTLCASGALTDLVYCPTPQ
ncbi:hypothetical protein Poly30_54810 [Planctomycetes bacterium Poly30]|uniref:Uncharacterized protein n=1 Tax=Saltatorellus ferox TaxID=2528018 RepID=A0A518F0Q2_9BACT|nr:hypothetical protein Poly30_54810 [Planctomycetes bacterium Poly30]